MSDIIEIRRVSQTDWRQYLLVDGEWRESGALTLGVGFASGAWTNMGTPEIQREAARQAYAIAHAMLTAREGK